jgi:hypothetical protein
MESHKMITRNEYIQNSNVLHNAYYEQFVEKTIINYVIQRFTTPRLVQAYLRDNRFNTIPLSEWDSAVSSLWDSSENTFPKAFYLLSLAGAVCVLKAAARIIAQKEIEEQLDRMSGR